MIFPFYRDGKLSYDQRMIDYTVPMDHNFIRTKRETSEISSAFKQKPSSEGLEWLNKKSGKYEQIQKFNLQNSSRRKNFCQLPLAKFFIRRKSIIDPKQTQQTGFPKQNLKRFHTESQYLDNKRKSFYLDKTFNQTFVDTQHNFIGKNYQKQVQNIKYNSQNSPESKLNLFLSTTVKSTNKKKSSSLTFQKSYKPEQKSQNLFVKKKISLGEKISIKKSKNFLQQTPPVSSKQQSINVQLRREIQKSVKDDIKAQITKFKKSKLIKFKFKQNHIKSQKKSLQIQQAENFIEKVQERQPNTPENPSKFLTQYNCQNRFKGKKHLKVIKKSHSSFNCYQIDQTKVQNKKITVPIFDNLDPWQGESTQFYGFR